MNESEFLKLVDKKRYQVFLCKTKVNGPFVFASHCYFVTNYKGKINRYDIIIFQQRNAKSKHFGHLFTS